MSTHAAKLLTCLDLAVKIQIARNNEIELENGKKAYIAINAHSVTSIADQLISWFDARVEAEQASQTRRFAVPEYKPIDTNTKLD